MLDLTEIYRHFEALAPAPRWYVALSGGVDSTALLHLAQRWCGARQGAPWLAAVHVNHGLQSAADTWQAHCEAACSALGVPLVTRRVSVAGAGEAAAREARYGAFAGVLEAGEVLLLAHHLDDQVETFFLRLMRGAGAEGLASMPAARDLGAGRLARPLLGATRADIERWAREEGLDWVEDPSNLQLLADRNFLRHEVLPLLASRWPAYRRTVARAGAHMAAQAEVLRGALGVPETIYSITGDPGLPLADLVEPPEPVAARNLRNWLRQRGEPAPGEAPLGEFLRQLRAAGEDAAPQLRTGAWSLQRYRDAVYRVPAFSAPAPGAPVAIRPGERREVAGVGSVALLPDESGLPLGAQEDLLLTWRDGGERCRVAGRGSIPLKQLLQELGVPPWWRPRLPLLCRDGEVLAVGDLVLCEHAAGTPAQGRWALCWARDCDLPD